MSSAIAELCAPETALPITKRRGRPRVIQDYAGLSRDEFYRRRYRAKKAAENPEAPAKPETLKNSSDYPFVIESAPEGQREIVTGFRDSNFDRIGDWAQTNGLMSGNDIEQSNGSSPSIFGVTEHNDQSEWHDTAKLEAKIAELLKADLLENIRRILETESVEHIQEVLTVTNYIWNSEGSHGGKVHGQGTSPDQESIGGFEVYGLHDSLQESAKEVLFEQETAIEDGKFRCLICPTLGGGRSRETVSNNRETAFDHFKKHNRRICKALRNIVPKQCAEWRKIDSRVAKIKSGTDLEGRTHDRIWTSFDKIEPRVNSQDWLKSRGIEATPEEMKQVHSQEPVTR